MFDPKERLVWPISDAELEGRRALAREMMGEKMRMKETF
jgi:hypothetical protein